MNISVKRGSYIKASTKEFDISLLDMFDFSAAFDTADHAILLRCLEISFGMHGIALKWFSSTWLREVSRCLSP